MLVALQGVLEVWWWCSRMYLWIEKIRWWMLLWSFFCCKFAYTLTGKHVISKKYKCYVIMLRDMLGKVFNPAVIFRFDVEWLDWILFYIVRFIYCIIKLTVLMIWNDSGGNLFLIRQLPWIRMFFTI